VSASNNQLQNSALAAIKPDQQRLILEELLANSPAAIGVLSGPELRWSYVNAEQVRVSGRRAADDFIGKTVPESLPELEAEPFLALLREVYRTGRPHIGRETKVILKRTESGAAEERFFDFVYQPMRNASGAVDGILVNAVEVTDNVRARQTGDAVARRLDLAQAAAQVGTWEWDPVANTEALSPELHRIFGTNPSDSHYVTVWQSRVHAADWPLVERCMAEGHSAGVIDFEYRYQHPSRGLRWIHCKGSRLHGKTTMLGIVQDITARKLAEESVRESEERFRAIVETTQECVNLVAADGTLLHINRAGLEMIAANGADVVIGKNIYELVAPEDRERFMRFNQSVCQGHRGCLEFRIISLDGTQRHMEAHAAPLRLADGSTVQLAISRDVSERKRAETALRESEQRFRVVTEASPIMVWMAGTDKLCYWFNKGWLEFVGRPLEKEIGNGWADNVHPDDFDRCLEFYVTNFDARRPFEMEYRLRHRNGQYRWILDHGVPRYAPDGTFEGYVGGCLDIHDRKEIQKQLEAALVASQRLAAIVESSDDAIISKDLNSIVTSWNPAAERLFGYPAREMVGQSILKIIPPELQDDEVRILNTIARGERIDHFETVRVTKQGEPVDVSLTISPVKDQAGRIVGAAKIVRDITQQKKTEHALRTSERLASVGRLAATVAHEINNPLEAITNLVYLAKRSAVRSEVREFLGSAEEELERVFQISRQTLGFYRETKGAGSVCVGEIVESLLSVFASRAANKCIELIPEIKSDVTIHAVPGEIRQLIGNLVTNSIDAVELGGRIRVRVSSAQLRNRSGVMLTVADNGPGIPAHVRSRLFEPFFTTKKDVGTGLGLWVCKSIVEKHRGKIRVTSRSLPGRSGTVFSVFLPANAARDSEESLRQAV
jgi:PAS domain S-box-containing protein